MLTVVSSTLQLYRDALHATGRSLVRGWFVILAVIVFTLLMMLAHQIARPLGMLGGFLLGAVNALLIGATLSLIEQCIKGMRTITMQDVMESMGHYFWDVISVGFCTLDSHDAPRHKSARKPGQSISGDGLPSAGVHSVEPRA